MMLERTLVPNLPLVSTKLAKNGVFTLGNEPSCETMISPLVHTIVENKPFTWWRTILLLLVRSIYLMENHPLAVLVFHLPLKSELGAGVVWVPVTEQKYLAATVRQPAFSLRVKNRHFNGLWKLCPHLYSKYISSQSYMLKIITN